MPEGSVPLPPGGRKIEARGLTKRYGAMLAVDELSFVHPGLVTGFIGPNGAPHVLRALVSCGLYGALIGLLGLALGTLLRHAAGAIAVLVAVIFVLPAIAAALPSSIEHTVEKYWPTQAGQQVTVVVRGAHSLSPWAGLGLMCLLVAIALSASLVRRDA